MNDTSLFNRKLFILRPPEDFSGRQSLVTELSEVPGMDADRLCGLLTGFGFCELPVTDGNLSLAFSVLKKYGVAVVAGSPPEVICAYSVQLSEQELTLFDRAGKAVFRVDPSTDLLMFMINGGGEQKTETLLRKSGANHQLHILIPCFDGHVDIYSPGNLEKPVRVTSSDFAFVSLGKKMGLTRGASFSALINEISIKSRSYLITDACLSENAKPKESTNRDLSSQFFHEFAAGAIASSLVHKEPEKNSGKKEQLQIPRLVAPSPQEHSLIRLPDRKAFLFLLTFSLLFFAIILSRKLGMERERLALLITVAGAALSFYGLYLVKIRRTVADTPFSKAGSVSMGIAGITGTAVAKYELYAPYLLMPCVYYECSVYERAGEDWRLRRRFSSGRIPFYLMDDSGRIEVDPNGGHLCGISRYRQVLEGDSFSKLGVSGIDRDTKVVLDLIPEGQPVYVLGFAERRWRKKTVSERIWEKVGAIKFSKASMARFDLNGDRKIDESETENAVRQFEQEIRIGQRGKRVMPQLDVVLGRATMGKYPFIISSSRNALLKKLWFDAAVSFVTGVALAAFSNSVVRFLM